MCCSFLFSAHTPHLEGPAQIIAQHLRITGKLFFSIIYPSCEPKASLEFSPSQLSTLCTALAEATPPLHRATPHPPPASSSLPKLPTRTRRRQNEAAEEGWVVIAGDESAARCTDFSSFCLVDEL